MMTRHGAGRTHITREAEQLVLRLDLIQDIGWRERLCAELEQEFVLGIEL
jgi:hypothetical protein